MLYVNYTPIKKKIKTTGTHQGIFGFLEDSPLCWWQRFKLVNVTAPPRWGRLRSVGRACSGQAQRQGHQHQEPCCSHGQIAIAFLAAWLGFLSAWLGFLTGPKWAIVADVCKVEKQKMSLLIARHGWANCWARWAHRCGWGQVSSELCREGKRNWN